MKSLKLFMLIALIGAATSSSAQSKSEPAAANSVTDLNATSDGQLINSVESAEKQSPSSVSATEVSERTVVRKEIARTPEMLERKKREPKLAEPQ
ncbi:MAG: hypothetical protein RL266_1309 [Bacteroidota bacterium]